MDLKSKLVEYQLFPKKYFSGSDAYIIIGNKVVDEIRSLEIEMTQFVAPILGYASYTTDAIAYGARIVNGKFTINFREAGYLNSVLSSSGIDKQTQMGVTSPEALYATDAAYIAELVKQGSYDKLKVAMKAQEDIVWGTKETPYGKHRYYEPSFIPDSDTGDLRRNGFDLIISYGDASFHVGDVLGEIPSTVDVINGVHITGIRKLIEPTGDNIIEEYTFMAKDFNNVIGSTKTNPNAYTYTKTTLPAEAYNSTDKTAVHSSSSGVRPNGMEKY